MLTIDYILVILSQVCKFSDSLLYGVFLVFSLFFSIFLLFSRFFTYFVNLTEIEKILLRVSSIFPVPVRSKLPDYSNRCIFAKIQALHYSLYPYVHRKSITLSKRKKSDAVGNFIADPFYLFQFINAHFIIRTEQFCLVNRSVRISGTGIYYIGTSKSRLAFIYSFNTCIKYILGIRKSIICSGKDAVLCICIFTKSVPAII